MAKVKVLVGSSLLVLIGNGAVPEVFAHDCLINTTRGIQLDSDQSEFVVPDCDAPSDPAWRELFIDNLKAQISGAGLLHTTSVETWFNWWKGGLAKNIRFKNDVTGANGGGYIAGEFKLTSFSWSAAGNKEYANAEVSLMSHGALTWTDNS